MTNTLWVKFTDDPSLYTYFVATGNRLKDVVREIEAETSKHIEIASYNRKEVE